MSSNESRKYSQIINYIEDSIGADVNRDLLKVAIAADDISGLGVDLQEVSGTAQSAVDVANQIDLIQNVLDSGTLTVTDNGSFNIAGVTTIQEDAPVDVSASEVDVDLNSQSISPLTVTDDGDLAIASWDAGTLPTESQSPTGIEDSSGAQIDPDVSPNYPDESQSKDLIGSGDLTIGPVDVSRTEAIIISAKSEEGAAWSASVQWGDGNSNTVQEEQSTDITLDSVQDDYARLIRKGKTVTVTFTDSSGGSANNINAYLDTHK